MKKVISFLFIALVATSLHAQKKQFTRQDSLRGSITKERIWWDLNYYHLDVQVFPTTKSIKGKNTIKYKVLSPYQVMQIDLQAPLKITRVTQNGKDLKVIHEGNAHFIQLVKKQKLGAKKHPCCILRRTTERSRKRSLGWRLLLEKRRQWK